MGDGRLSCIALDDKDEATWITIPNDLLIPLVDNPIEAIVSSTYPDLPNRIQDIKYLKEICILSPTNDVVDKINSHILDSMSGEMHELFSADKICSTSDNLKEMQIMYPPQFLNTLRIDMTPTDSSWPFRFIRRQFLVKVCFAMIINKSQGQTFNHVCAYLEKPVFTHGQLYVAALRVTSRVGLRFYIDNGGICANNLTKNIVYKEVFYNLPRGDLHPNLTDKWTVNFMVARLWTTYNPTTNQILSIDLIIVDERIPASLINRFGNRVKEGCVYKIHKFTVNNYGDIKYRPLEIKFFVQFGYTTDIQPSSLQPQLFDRYVFKFVPFENLQRRIENETYLTGVLREWGPLQNNVESIQGCNPQFHKFVIADMRHIHPVVFTSTNVKTNVLKVTPVTQIYQCLADGATMGTKFIVYGMVIGFDLDKDWKFTQCTKCLHKVTLDGVRYYCEFCRIYVTKPRQTYKLVIQVRDHREDIDCVLFNSDATQLLGITVKDLITKTLTEGTGDPNWIVDYFFDNLCTQWVVLEIKIDKFNLPPKYVKRYTVTKYYGSDVNDLNKHRGSSTIPGSVPRMEDSNVPVDDPIHDVSHAKTELTIAVNTFMCPSSKAIAETKIDEIPNEVKDVAVDQHVELMQNEGSE
ncbi:replication protein A 70 kDa DNA-binding subunit B [Tanacetum coccineum]